MGIFGRRGGRRRALNPQQAAAQREASSTLAVELRLLAARLNTSAGRLAEVHGVERRAREDGHQ